MPQAPMLPPDQMAAAQANAGLNPVNFLIAAADMQNKGQLSAPQGQDVPLQTGSKRTKRKLQVLK